VEGTKEEGQKLRNIRNRLNIGGWRGYRWREQRRRGRN
jgi:hypothetical protein